VFVVAAEIRAEISLRPSSFHAFLAAPHDDSFLNNKQLETGKKIHTQYDVRRTYGTTVLASCWWVLTAGAHARHDALTIKKREKIGRIIRMAMLCTVFV
jgi:hypothetical protein